MLNNDLSKLADITNRGFSLLVRTIKTILHINTEYKYTTFSIILPAYHLLPTYQKYSNLYDKFLPHLAKYLEPHSTVIDVGANCGDTLAAMYDANNRLTYICVEADEEFFDFLQTNVSRIKAIDANASIATIKALAGRNVTDVSLEGSGGTKKAIIGGSKTSILPQSLDDIVPVSEASTISLLKTDVEGFDYDVIESAGSIIARAKPLIFIECVFDHAFQKTGYERTIANLRAKGYGTWVLFDNFGAVVLRTNDMHQVVQLFDYVWRQNSKHSARTIYYFDVLTFMDKDDQLMDRVISDYIALAQ
jgi:FkbM family methyltransferase